MENRDNVEKGNPLENLLTECKKTRELTRSSIERSIALIDQAKLISVRSRALVDYVQTLNARPGHTSPRPPVAEQSKHKSGKKRRKPNDS